MTTHWSVVLRAGEADDVQAGEALESLCRSYWYPLYAYARRKGYNPEDAEDLTQEFLARLLEKKYLQLADRRRGRFRTFLLSAFKNFLINEWKKTNREKRGNGRELVRIDEDFAESRLALEQLSTETPDSQFDRGWAATLLDRALAALRCEFVQAGKGETVEVLKVFVWGEKSSLTYAKMAVELNMTEGSIKVAIHRLRQRFGQLLRAEVAQTVATPTEVDEELRYLASVMRDGGVNPL